MGWRELPCLPPRRQPSRPLAQPDTAQRQISGDHGGIGSTPRAKTTIEKACRQGWEGVIAKNADSEYVSRRTRDWLKFKCSKAQEFVVGGYTEPHGSRIGFGALLLGYYCGGRLV
jgi:bifunctional non-homologous end joining protein LigD